MHTYKAVSLSPVSRERYISLNMYRHGQYPTYSTSDKISCTYDHTPLMIVHTNPKIYCIQRSGHTVWRLQVNEGEGLIHLLLDNQPCSVHTRSASSYSPIASRHSNTSFHLKSRFSFLAARKIFPVGFALLLMVSILSFDSLVCTASLTHGSTFS